VSIRWIQCKVGDFITILQGLGRGLNLIPFARNDVMSFFLTTFFLVAPIFILILSIFFLTHSDDPYTGHNLLSQALLIISLMTILTIVCVSVIQSKIGLCQNLMYGLASPIAGLLLSFVFGFIIVNRKKNGTTGINWRGRQYVTSTNR
jgi:hypothetical protein